MTFAFATFTCVFWTISFGFVQAGGKTGGWLSVKAWIFPLCLGLGVYHHGRFGSYGGGSLLSVGIFQWIACLSLIIQRWQADIGSIAYIITDFNGCTASETGVLFLEGGARSRIFRILQTVEFAVISSQIWVGYRVAKGYTMPYERRRQPHFPNGEAVYYLYHVSLPQSLSPNREGSASEQISEVSDHPGLHTDWIELLQVDQIMPNVNSRLVLLRRTNLSYHNCYKRKACGHLRKLYVSGA